MDENVTFKEKIAENDHYEVWIAKLPDSPVLSYAIVNKQYGVVEMSTTILSHAKKMCSSLNEWENGREPNPVADGLPDVIN